MEKVTKSEINLTSDSEDFFDDYWFLSSSASHDGSSVNSIPWADDVVKQHQELWDRVERMFYGEESLPANDTKLSNEIREWTTHFPYFRVSGIAMPINTAPSSITTTTNAAEHTDATPSDPYYEEILAMHPSPDTNTCKSAASLCHTARTVRTARTSRQPSGDDANPIHDDQLANDIEKYLRITSGPLLSRRTQNSRTAYHFRANNSNSLAENAIQPTSKWHPSHNRNHKPQLKSALVHRSHIDEGTHYVRKLYSSIDTERMHAVPYSARLIKVPALKNPTRDFNAIPIPISSSSSSSSSTAAVARLHSSIANTTAIKPNIIRIKTATLLPISRPLRNSITLPAIKIEPQYFDRNLCGDAISALIYPNTSLNSPNKMLKKRSESE